MQDDIYTDNPSENELNFRYSREERLKNAPDTVKRYYAGEGPTPPKGFFKALVHTKSSRFTFMALILVLALVVSLIFFGPKANESSLQNTNFTLSAFSFEEKIFISIKTETQETKQINLPLEITISVFDNEKQLINQQKIESLITQKEEFIRTIFTDYDIISVEVEVTNTDTKESILLTSMFEKN
ncbi:MAG: hypothetical protein IJD23_06245 [Spirochaetaceae bacterium]|nr:hypothetical protein [Spirochaetaceae bacterium]